MQIYILRHGDAEQPVTSDDARRLTNRGVEEVRQVVASTPELAEVEAVFVSPLVRAQQTAALVLEAIGERPIETCEDLRPDSVPTEILKRLEQSEFDRVLLVSHQPLVGSLVNGVAGKDENFYHMGTGALALLEVSHPAMGCGRCRWLKRAS